MLGLLSVCSMQKLIVDSKYWVKCWDWISFYFIVHFKTLDIYCLLVSEPKWKRLKNAVLILLRFCVTDTALDSLRFESLSPVFLSPSLTKPALTDTVLVAATVTQGHLWNIKYPPPPSPSQYFCFSLSLTVSVLLSLSLALSLSQSSLSVSLFKKQTNRQN